MRVPQLIRDVLDFCYPGRCAACDSDCAGSQTLCASCDDLLARLEDQAACRLCAMPLVEEGAPCPYCEGDGVPHYEHILRLGIYSDPIKHLVHHVKYHGRWALAEFLADRLARRPGVRALLDDADCLVPVPLHRLRQVTRGYNQAEVIARVLAKRSRGRLRVARPVVRLRNTETQTHLHSRARREENLRDAFGLVDGWCVHEQRVVVVDDVITTGATLQSFARALQPAKPQKLSAVLLAIADPEGRDFEVI